jgi:tryptophan-rich sensory protein
MTRRTRDILGWLAFAAVTLAVSALAAQFQPGEWYRQIAKPSWTPPGWVFGPVWTFLYLAMATAAWLVWRKFGWPNARPAMIAYAVQLFFNGLWSWFFFGRQEIGLALIDIVLLWLAILLTTILFFRRVRLAGWLFMPYLLWVSFATALNFQIWRLN